MTLLAGNPRSANARRWTAEEYLHMADAGFFNGQHVELIEGTVIEMAPQKEQHTVAVELAAQALRRAFGADCWVRVQSTLRLTGNSLPEPDIAVVQGTPREHLGKDNRAQPLLVIEVSDTTLAFDRGDKARLYARAAIADYWIINLVDRAVDVYREPQPDAQRADAFEFAAVKRFNPGQSIAPLARPNVNIAVDDLLP